MRHKVRRHRVNRFTSWHKATVSSMLRSILKYESIKTTKAKALLIRPVLDRLISDALEGTLVAKRRAFELLGDHALVSHLFGEIAGRFKDKKSGFTRIIGNGIRRGDSAEMVIFELTEVKKKEPKKAKKKTAHEHTEGEHAHEAHEGKPVDEKKPKKFLGGIKGIFKKERDAL